MAILDVAVLTLSIAAVPRHPSVAAVDCWRDGWTGSSSITTSTNRRGRSDRIVQKNFSDVRVCVSGDDVEKGNVWPSDWSGQRVVLMSEERGGDVRRLEVDRGVTIYTVNGRPTAFDSDAREWRRALLDVLDAVAEASEIRGQV